MELRHALSSISRSNIHRALNPTLQRLRFQGSSQTSNSHFFTQHRSFSFASGLMAPYPTRDEIGEIFKHMETGNYPEVFKRVDPNVDWTVMGTHPLAGRYTSLKDFQQATFARLAKIMKDPGIRLKVKNVIGGGEHDWATVELLADAECLNGMRFDNTYAWCMRFDENGQIVEVRAYLDSQMVKQAIEDNEEGESERSPVLAS